MPEEYQGEPHQNCFAEINQSLATQLLTPSDSIGKTFENAEGLGIPHDLMEDLQTVQVHYAFPEEWPFTALEYALLAARFRKTSFIQEEGVRAKYYDSVNRLEFSVNQRSNMPCDLPFKTLLHEEQHEHRGFHADCRRTRERSNGYIEVEEVKCGQYGEDDPFYFSVSQLYLQHIHNYQHKEELRELYLANQSLFDFKPNMLEYSDQHHRYNIQRAACIGLQSHILNPEDTTLWKMNDCDNLESMIVGLDLPDKITLERID
jgi:hypothetical protein